MTFIDILNNPETRRMVEAIEDTLSSLQNYPHGDPTLQACLASQVEALRVRAGYTYNV